MQHIFLFINSMKPRTEKLDSSSKSSSSAAQVERSELVETDFKPALYETEARIRLETENMTLRILIEDYKKELKNMNTTLECALSDSLRTIASWKKKAQSLYRYCLYIHLIISCNSLNYSSVISSTALTIRRVPYKLTYESIFN
jgi:hypothetical protein